MVVAHDLFDDLQALARINIKNDKFNQVDNQMLYFVYFTDGAEVYGDRCPDHQKLPKEVVHHLRIYYELLELEILLAVFVQNRVT